MELNNVPMPAAVTANYQYRPAGVQPQQGSSVGGAYGHQGVAQQQPEVSRKPKRTIKPTTAYDGSKPSITGAGEGNQGYGHADDDDDETRRVTVWNPKTGKKLSGNAGVFKRNLARYLRTHPDWIVWTGQDKEAFRRKRQFTAQENSPKRRRVESYDYQADNKRRALEGLEDEMPTAASLWKSLLAVCSEKSILAEVDGMESEEEDEEGLGAAQRYGPNGSPYKSQFSTRMVHSGLMSPAVG